MLYGTGRAGVGDWGSCTRQYQMLTMGCGVLCGKKAGTGKLPQFSPENGELLGATEEERRIKDQEYYRMS